jgi:hypothetical protein
VYGKIAKSAPVITATVTSEFIMQQSYAENRDRGLSKHPERGSNIFSQIGWRQRWISED